MTKYHRASFPYPLIILTSFLILFVYIFSSSSFINRQSSIINQGPPPEVPEPNAASVDQETAVPSSVVESAPGTSSQIRTFSLSAQNSRLSKEKIIVYQGDIVHIRFSAHDDDRYDFAIPAFGLRQEAAKGETRIVEFQAVSQGSFPIICSQCKTEGELVVVPKA